MYLNIQHLCRIPTAELENETSIFLLSTVAHTPVKCRNKPNSFKYRLVYETWRHTVAIKYA